MKRWNATITDQGLNMLANVTDARPLRIVRMACASGRCADAELRAQTALTNYVSDIPIMSSEQRTSLIYEIKGQIDNTGLAAGYNLTQIGVFAKLGSGEDEVLFMISQISSGAQADVIPSEAESPGFLATYAMDLVFSSETNVEVVVDGGSLAEAKAYTDAKITAISARVASLEGSSAYIFDDSVTFTLAAADWTSDPAGYWTQTKYASAMKGIVVDCMRGSVGLGTTFNDDAKIQAAAEANIFAEKNGSDGIIFKAYGKKPNVDIPAALNLEYDGSGVGNALFSVFPIMKARAAVVYTGTAVIPTTQSYVFDDVNIAFDTVNYTYNAEITSIRSTEEDETSVYRQPVFSALNTEAKKIVFKLLMSEEHNDTVSISYRIVREAL
ncbi:MAG: hypothetical protein IJ736_16290 [Firmicutes bacterium]|nr:hypothetical protein [Bacillota bacterium]